MGVVPLLALPRPRFPLRTIRYVFSWIINPKRRALIESARLTPGDELRDHLTRLRFRPEVLPLASFQEGYIPHLDARNWARRLASNVYKQISKWVVVKAPLGIHV